MEHEGAATLGERIEDIEQQIDELAGQVERCRKAMLVSKWVGLAGCADLLFVAFDPYLAGATGFVLGVAAVIGSMVSYGGNRSSRLEAKERMGGLERLRAQLLDAAPMKRAVPGALDRHLPGTATPETPEPSNSDF